MRIGALLGVIAVAFACTGRGRSGSASVDPGAASNTPVADTPVANAPPAGKVTFAEVYREVIQGGCTSGYCHGASAGGLTMTDEASAYTALVGVQATEGVCGGALRVSPGSADASILWHRVRPSTQDGEKPCAQKMPSEAGLDAESAQLVKEWIDGGAPR